MHASRATLITVFLPALSFAQLPDFDFEDNLRGWTQTGAVFHAEPFPGSAFRTENVLHIPIGGSYWKGLPYEVGHHGRHWVSSFDSRTGNAATGSLTSEFPLDPSMRFFSFLIGGANDKARVYVALEIQSSAAGDYVEEFRDTGPGREDLVHRAFTIPISFLDRRARARIRIVDNSREGHINVDYFRFTPDQPIPFRGRVWGWGDYHAHPMTHIGFGALKGVRTVWGVPGEDYEKYIGQKPGRFNEWVARDIPNCVRAHCGGPIAEVFINTVQERHPGATLPALALSWIQGKLNHPRKGGPTFKDFPAFLAGAHEQMHITQIHRAWEGGLRLMVALAVHNRGAEYLMSSVADDGIDPSKDLAVLKAQICATRQLAKLNQSWMRIAYTPEEARDIIHDGKLAVILGVEMAQMSELGFSSMEEEVKFLWELGIRQVFPVHGPDNKLAGAAVFQDAYNLATDLIYRDKLNIWRADEVPDRFMQVEEGCPYDGDPACARYKLDPPARAVLMKLFGTQMPFVTPARTEYRHLEPTRGHRNVRGLSDRGKDYIKLLMNHGMLVDLAHMSEHSVEGVYSVLGERSGDPACSKIGFEDVPDRCYEGAYPLVASHVHFRSLSAHNDRTTFKGFRTQEYQVSDHQADMLRRTGGLVGQFVTEYPIEAPFVGPQQFRNDCGMSSKSFAYSFLYGLQKMDRRGVGIASDVTFIPMVSPRFGPKACSGYIQADHPSREKKAWPDQYRHNKEQDDRTRVTYRPRNPDGLEQYCVLERCFDFNSDGLSHYGMLPDMLQDLKNLGLRGSDFEALFRSAEGYLETWEKAESLAAPEFRLAPWKFHHLNLDCKTDCHGLCPNDDNAGAPNGSCQK